MNSYHYYSRRAPGWFVGDMWVRYNCLRSLYDNGVAFEAEEDEMRGLEIFLSLYI